jgi:hypothetical protein
MSQRRASRLFEFEDLSWFPATIRNGGTDFLRFFFSLIKFYTPAIDVLEKLLRESGRREIIDLCSGGGGNMEMIQREVSRRLGEMVRVTMTDKYPNHSLHTEHIRMSSTPVDVLDRIPDSPGIRTMFSAIHHFNEEQVKTIIRNATATGEPVAIFDGADRNFFTFLGIPLVQPLLFALFTPFFRPFRLSTLAFTYLIPAIPLMTVWDGMVSVYRLYSTEKLLEMARQAEPNYAWQSNRIRNKFGLSIACLYGSRD